MTLKQRPTQTAAYWQSDFEINQQSLDALYNLFVETGSPQSLERLGLFFVQHALQVEEQAIQAELGQGDVYQPDRSYQVGDKLVFPNFGYATAGVVGVRSGYNPVDEEFAVIDVVFNDAASTKTSFAAGFQHPHNLLSQGSGDDAESKDDVAQGILDKFRNTIISKVQTALTQNPDYVEFNQNWLLRDMLVDIQEGLLNIIDAAIDINAGPLNVDELIEPLDLQQEGVSPAVLQFSVNYKLANNPQFLNVGTIDSVLWYLSRLKPADVLEMPHNLKVRGDLLFEAHKLPLDLQALMKDIDDEATPPEFAKTLGADEAEITFVLNYPHRRAGTLPLLPAVRQLLPEADGRLLALSLVDGQSGDEMVGWFVGDKNYIFGLADWFKTYELPVGAFITLKKTNYPLKFIIDFVPQRSQRDWVRVVTVKNNHLAFEMKNRALACRYDELMMLGEEGSTDIDQIWQKFEQNKVTLHDVLVRIFPELMKLSAQHAVHTNTLYSAVNVVRRCPPGPLLQELAGDPVFVWMGHGYWTYKPA